MPAFEVMSSSVQWWPSFDHAQQRNMYTMCVWSWGPCADQRNILASFWSLNDVTDIIVKRFMWGSFWMSCAATWSDDHHSVTFRSYKNTHSNRNLTKGWTFLQFGFSKPGTRKKLQIQSSFDVSMWCRGLCNSQRNFSSKNWYSITFKMLITQGRTIISLCLVLRPFNHKSRFCSA